MIGSHFTEGLRKHPLAGFARSVYHTLTGQKIPVYLEHLNNRTVIRNKYTASEDKTAIIYPNPTDHKSITVTLSDFDAHATYSCVISDLFGRHACQYILSTASQNLDLTNSNPGIFIIKIIKNDRVEQIEKLIVH